MDYILLLRGINVGGKNKVSMPILKEQLTQLGFENVHSYINSGNFLFQSDQPEEKLADVLQQCFQKEYEFQLNFSLVNTQDF
ncbi:Uncharacterized protein conserved in bacteria [Chlamydia trachomatis]|nr:Uncharacterized protein conserved in bacteria [Chlamydia trachomatis]